MKPTLFARLRAVLTALAEGVLHVRICSKIVRRVLVSFALVAPVWAAAAPMAWFADDANVYQADASTRSLLRSIALSATALAAEPSGGAWVVTASSVVRLDAQGAAVVTLSLNALGLIAPVQVAADPRDGSAWLMGERTLLHLSPTGQLLHSAVLSGDNHAVAVAVGLDQRVWALGKAWLVGVTANGLVQSQTKVSSDLGGPATGMGLDPLSPTVWVVREDAGGSSRRIARVDTSTTQPSVASLTSVALMGVATDVFAGGAWTLPSGGIHRYSATGALVQTITLGASGLGAARRIAVDPSAGALWLGRELGITVIAPDGTAIGEVPTGGPVKLLSLSPFRPQPTLTLLTPPPVVSTNNRQPTITLAYGVDCYGIACPLTAGRLGTYVLSAQLDGAQIGPSFAYDAAANRATYAPAPLADGVHPFSATVSDRFGQVSNAVGSTITIDNVAPRLIELTPPDGSRLTQSAITVAGRIDERGFVQLGATAVQGPAFSLPVTLAPGVNALPLSLTDAAGNNAQMALTYHYLTLAIASPADGATVQTASVQVSGSFTGPADTQVTVNGVAAAATASTYSATAPLVVGTNSLAVTATSAGVSVTRTITVTRVAPTGGTTLTPSLIDKTTVSILANTTAFLYSGPNPVQTGVAPGTIEPRRAAVVRGKVLARDGQVLTGVKVTILNNAQYGQTLSRADGMFDMAVNGGGVLVINYEKAGFLPVQRQAKVPWQDFSVIDDVVMVALDANVTTVNLATPQPIQVARGGAVSDTDGTRRATVMFPQGTTASLVLPDGSLQSLTTLNVRATEYTVGATGPKAMPGPLPPTSGYTYAVELSVDEAITANATDVRFSQPVPVYVENFLNFPVGGIVPLGYYDRQKAVWVPAPNGRVIKVVAVAGGLADLDINGDGTADDATTLAAIGITDAERGQVANLYAPGQSLWRVHVTHFTPWDCNWPFGPPPDATPPTQPEPEADKPEEDPCANSGSIIECQNQTLGERVGLAGVPITLNYRSDRVEGRKAANILSIQIAGPTVPPSLRRIELEIHVAGRVFTRTFSNAPSQRHEFTWDGLDTYGRRVYGAQFALVQLGYVYQAQYQAPLAALASFGLPSGTPISGSRAREEITIWQETRTPIGIGGADARAQGLGGWTVDAHHAYDPALSTLYLGTGERRNASILNRVITRVGGTGSGGLAGDGGPAVAAQIGSPIGIATDSQGSIYIAANFHNRIRKISPNGIVTTIAGTGGAGYSGDGGPAVDAQLNSPYGVAVDSLGNVYFADMQNHRVRRISTDGTIATIAGNGTSGFSGDSGPALQAQLSFPLGVAVDSSGAVYIADYLNNRVRRVAPDGSISTIAGSGSDVYGGDGGPAVAAGLSTPVGVAVDPLGAVYVAQSASGHRVRKIGPDGVITTVAGNGTIGSAGDGGAATAASLNNPLGLAIDSGGNLFISTATANRIRVVRPNGVISTYAGTGAPGGDPSGDGGPPTAGRVNFPIGLAITPAGDLVIAERGWNRIREVSNVLPKFDGTSFVVASPLAPDLFEFDSSGRHQRTVDSRTGALRYRFNYTAGQLTQVTDGDGNVTAIERDAAGLATAIVAPHGQRTTLAHDANGWLASIADPLAQTHRAEYSADGLLTRFTNSRNQASTMSYDALGRLTRDANAALGSWDLTRDQQPTFYTAGMTSAEGRSTTYRVESTPTGDQRRVNRFADGTQVISLRGKDGSTITTLADGRVVTTLDGPDPRFGMQAPIQTSRTTRLPSGLTSSVTTDRSVVLANPNDLLSLTQETTRTALNGGPFFSAVYDAASRQTTATSAQGRSAATRTDAQGRPVFTQLPGLEATSYSYDPRGRLASVTQGSGTQARSLSYSYGADGYLERITDALTQDVVYQRDAVGRPTRTTLPGARVLEAAFDANGNTSAITPPGQPAHGFGFTPVDLEAQYSPPALPGITDVATRFAYNRDKDLTRIDRPDGSSIGLAYNPLGQLEAVTPSAGAGNAVAYGYSPGTGQLASIATADASLALSHDGPLVTQEAMSGAVAASIARSFDANLRVTGLSVNGVSSAYGYDFDGLLTQAGALAIARHPGNGLPTGSTLGSLVTSQGYNGFGELASFAAAHGATPLMSYTLGYDKGGRITGKTETVLGATTTYGYSYDAAGRLASVSQNSGVIASYGFDANGNRTQVNGTTVATVDAQDRLLAYGTASYLYTAHGSLREKTQGGQTTRYAYDAFGNLKSVELPGGGRIDYLVDGANRRIGKKVNGTLVQGFVWQDQLRIAAELDGAGNVVARFVYGDRPNVPETMSKGGVTYRLVTDHLGSVRLVVDAATGAIAQRIDYDEWGRVTSDSNPGFQPFGYAGGLYDASTGLVRFGARDYDAQTGRWTAKDPIGFAGGDANLMAYVGGNPVGKTDSNGRGPIAALACTIANAAYGIYKLNNSLNSPINGTQLNRELMTRINKEISECPAADTKRLQGLLDIRNDLIKQSSVQLQGNVNEENKLGLGDVGEAAIIQGVCALLFYAPTP